MEDGLSPRQGWVARVDSHRAKAGCVGEHQWSQSARAIGFLIGTRGSRTLESVVSQHRRALDGLVNRKGVAFQDDESGFLVWSGLQDSLGSGHKGDR